MNRKCLICGFRKDQIDGTPRTDEIGLFLVYLICQVQAISICLELLERELTTLDRCDGTVMNLNQEYRRHVQFLLRADAYTRPQAIVRHADGSVSAANACVRTWRERAKMYEDVVVGCSLSLFREINFLN
jgi:hypothetical protein